MASDEKTREAIETLRGWIDECPDGGMVFFGGAGVSTESGIPDFRSAHGIFMRDLGGAAIEHALAAGDLEGAERLRKLQLRPEEVVSRSFFDAFPREFFAFYFDKMIFNQVKPNAAHRKLAELEARGTLSAIVTQNIDGLHHKAGSSNVFELHGSVMRNLCMDCGASYTLEETEEAWKRSCGGDGIPRCGHCGGIIKPDVVLYEEGLDDDVIRGSVEAIYSADLLVIAGTSLLVNPAASLIRYFRGRHLVVVNLSPTQADEQANLVIRAKVGEVFDY
ncbi:MAG: NAD-dependent protein deacylase [bacterium]|nr:NAD-dependent protein deacylase [bacterium]